MRRIAACLLLVALAAPFRARAGDGPAAAAADGPTTRIVSMMPNATEILFALGAADQVAGVSDYCAFPAEAARKPRVGGLLNPNIERLLLLRPTRVLLHSGQGELAARLAGAGVRAELLRADTVEDVFDSVGRLGALTGRGREADAMLAGLRASIPWPPPAPGDDTGSTAPRVLLVMAREPGSLRGLYAGGPRTHLGQILVAAGGRNVLDADDPRPSRQVGIEELIRANPDVVIDFSATDSGAAADRADTERLMEPWRALATVGAVRDGRVHFVTDPHLAVPGPAMGTTADYFRAILRGGARP